MNDYGRFVPQPIRERAGFDDACAAGESSFLFCLIIRTLKARCTAGDNLSLLRMGGRPE
ncbi:MAG: hypothetical protein ABIR00_01190 [Nitrosospira sp.]